MKAFHTNSRTVLVAFLAAIVLMASSYSFAEAVVVPSDRVTEGVTLRSTASSGSQPLGLLRPGETAKYLGEVPRWYRIEHPDQQVGFVSKSWTKLIDHDDSIPPGEFNVYFVDVATGLATFVRGPDFTLVYDAGSGDDKAGNRFLAFLEEHHADVSTIDHIIVSHPHEDHIEMLPDLLDEFAVNHIWDSGVIYGSCIYQKFLERVEQEGADYHTAIHHRATHEVEFKKNCASTGTSVELAFADRIQTDAIELGGGATMTFLHVDASEKSDVNENSLVVMLNLGGTRILLTGDSGGGERRDPSSDPDQGSVEQALLACCKNELVADILVLGHHGSKTSSRRAFLEATQAQDYVISSGPKDYSGVTLPDDEVVAAVESLPGARVWRTDDNDEACRLATNKIGPDADARAGGCDTIHVHIPSSGSRTVGKLELN